MRKRGSSGFDFDGLADLDHQLLRGAARFMLHPRPKLRPSERPGHDLATFGGQGAQNFKGSSREAHFSPLGPTAGEAFQVHLDCAKT